MRWRHGTESEESHRQRQYQHARKMAFCQVDRRSAEKVAQWVDDSVLLRSRYLFTHRENGVRYGHCTHCHKDVVLELGRTYSAADVQNVNCKHKEIGFLPGVQKARSSSATAAEAENICMTKNISFCHETAGRRNPRPGGIRGARLPPGLYNSQDQFF